MASNTWPNLFIVGAPKAGTTSLHAYLSKVPGVYMSTIKEPHFFSRVVVPDDHPRNPVRNEQQYLQLFEPGAGALYRGEASPSYLADPNAAELIRAASPDARIIISLRDPVDRIYSHYLMEVNNGRSRGTLMEEVKRGLADGKQWNKMMVRPEIGLYRQNVERYLDRFGEQRTLVIVFEELAANPRATLDRVLRFLGIDFDISDFETATYRRFGVARGPVARYLMGNHGLDRLAQTVLPMWARLWIRETLLLKKAPKPPLDDEARAFLISYYQDDVQDVARLLGRPLPWRNFPAVNPPEVSAASA